MSSERQCHTNGARGEYSLPESPPPATVTRNAAGALAKMPEPSLAAARH